MKRKILSVLGVLMAVILSTAALAACEKARMNRRCALTIELPETNTLDKSLLRRLNFL